MALVYALSLACADEDTSFVEHDETDESDAPADTSGADTTSNETVSDGRTPNDVITEREPLQPSTDDTSHASDSPEAPDSTGGAGGAGSAGSSESGGSGGSSETPVDPNPPGDMTGTTPPPGPLPDLVLDGEYLAATIQQDVVDASLDMCLIAEGCVTGTGLRRVIRFGTRSGNVGTADLVAGRPALDNRIWEFDACHQHFHFEGYAQYDLIDRGTLAVLPVGVKNGFCLRDQGSWDGTAPSGRCGAYDCDYQGLGIGCYDVYVAELDCQWIDITNVPPGRYELRVTINSERKIDELDLTNNSASVPLVITAETVQVAR